MIPRTTREVLNDIHETERQLERLREELSSIVSDSDQQRPSLVSECQNVSDAIGQRKWPLFNEEYQRYGRQLVMPEIGLSGQYKLRKSSVLIVGLGGLGCPAAKYLAGTGVGRIGLLDGDVVEVSNLHRQILHSTARVGIPKVLSAARSLAESNDTIKIETYTYHLTMHNCLEIFSHYDLILDCTDHPTSRYLISDAAVISGKPLVSASALKTEGQLLVLNSPPRKISHDLVTEEKVASGPCYRCIFPRPPPAEAVVSCGEGGILGPVVGVMGVLQALEAIKLITRDTSSDQDIVQPGMLIFSAYNNPQFRNLRMRPRRSDCAACGDVPTITRETLDRGTINYVAFCGVISPVNILSTDERLSATEVKNRLTSTKMRRPVVIDVRERCQYELGSLPGSINIPFSTFMGKDFEQDLEKFEGSRGMGTKLTLDSDLLFVCRMGNDSQVAAKKIKEAGFAENNRWIGDLEGGLKSWRDQIEPDFPDF